MFRALLKSVGVAALALVVLLGTERPAQAQFYPTWRPSPYSPAIPMGVYSTPWGTFSFGQVEYFSLYRRLPTGQTFAFNYYAYNAGLPLVNNYFVQPLYNPGLGTGLYGGFSSLGGTTYNPTLARMQQDFGRAQQAMAAGATGSSEPSDLSRWASSRIEGAKKDKDPEKVLDTALINPPEESILNGNVLNELAAQITKFEKAGKRAPSALCPPDLISKIVFESGPAADAANAFRTLTLNFPQILSLGNYADARSNLQEVFTPVATTVHAAKRVDVATLDKLLTAIRKARELAVPIAKEAGVSDSAAVSRFFNQLESATKFLKEPTSTGIIGAKWSTVGSNVSDLVTHMVKHKLKFGRVPTEDEAAYFSLHRAMLSYYASLSQVK